MLTLKINDSIQILGATVEEATELVNRLYHFDAQKKQINIVFDRNMPSIDTQVTSPKPITKEKQVELADDVHQMALPFLEVPSWGTNTYSYKIHQLLLKVKKPMHINDLIRGIGKRCTPRAKNSINAIIGKYAKAGKVFKRIGKGYYGLLDMDNEVMPIKKKKNYSIRRYPGTCLSCGKSFMGWSKTAKYCGLACRDLENGIRLEEMAKAKRMGAPKEIKNVDKRPTYIIRHNGAESRKVMD